MVDSIKFCGKTIRSLSIGSASGSSQASSQASESKQYGWRRFSGSSIGTLESNPISEEIDCFSEKPKKLIRLRNLKHGGTTIRNDTGQFDFFYNPLETGTNPYNTKSLNKEHGVSIELSIDPMSKNVYLPDLCIQGENPFSPSRSSPIYSNPSTALIPDWNEGSQNGLGVTISGKIKMVVTNQKKSVYIGTHRVKLKCFVHEYLCMVDPAKKESSASKRTVKLCKDESQENSHMLPYKEIEVDLLSSDGCRTFSGGTYEFPFSFHLIDFPASALSYFGKTLYRIESVISVTKSPRSNSPAFDTILLTDEINVKRVLPSANIGLQQESVSLQGHWDEYKLSYNVLLNSRLLEIGSPFGISIGLMKDRESVEKIKEVSVCLSQSFSIPCVDSKTLELLPTTYSSRNEVELYQIDVEQDAAALDDHDSFQYYEVDNLKIPPNDKKYRCKNWLKPFYCEMSTKFKTRARLKICHILVIKIKISNENDSNLSTEDEDSPKAQETCLNLKIPILLVDQDMANNLSLPPYDKTTPTEHLFIDDPPGYHHGDTIEPPKYRT